MNSIGEAINMAIIIVAAIFVVILGGLLLYANSVRQERNQLLLESANFKLTINSMAQEIEAQKLAVEQREVEKKRLAADKAALITKLNEVYANDEKARDWAAAPCPDGVLDCLLR